MTRRRPAIVSVRCRATFALAALVIGCGGSSSAGSIDASIAGDVSTPDAGTVDDTASTSDGASAGDTYVRPAPARNWTSSPAITEMDGAQELWVVSDVHGDYAAITKLLAGAGVITAAPSTPSDVTWSAGSAVLVVVGDLIDKGPDAPDVVTLFAALQARAKAAGGGVVVTMGNHEAEFLASPDNSKATSKDGFDPELVEAGFTALQTAAGDDAIGAFIRDLPFAARVDDWFFVHAGNTGGQTLANLEDTLQGEVDAIGFGAPILSDPDSLLEARLDSSGSQWWDATGDAAILLATWTGALGAKHLVMGHQPGVVAFADGTKRAQDQMVAKYDGLLFLVDTGLSVGVDDTGGALLHVTNVGAANVAWEEVMPDGSVRAL